MPAYFAYAFGVLGSLFFFDYVVKNTNTKANRQNALNLILDNINITGFATLRDWLSEDGFVQGVTYKEPPNLPTTYTIGDGAGKTVLGESQTISDWLRSLTASELLAVVNKAINHSPRGDTSQDRQQVLDWLNLVQSQVKNFDELYKNLNEIGWITGHPNIPPNVDIPLYIRFGSPPNQVAKYDYREFLMKAKTVDILGLVDGLIYPEDKDFEARELVYLSVLEGANATPYPIIGFKEFGTMLNFSGFISSPQTRKIPPNLPASFELGGNTYTQAELTNILQTASAESVQKVITSALASYDPTLTPRINALAQLKQNMNNFVPDDTKPFIDFLLSDLYPLLVKSGFLTSSPRKFTPVDASKFTGAVYSYGWTLIPDLNEWLKNATASEVSDIATTGAKTGIAYEKYLAYMTAQNQDIQNAMLSGGGDPNLGATMIERWDLLYESGMCVSPPNPFNQRMGFSNIAGGCGKSTPFPQPIQNIWDSKTGVNPIWSGEPSSDLLPINLWIGDAPNNLLGVFVKKDAVGQNNPFYCDKAYQLALSHAKTGKPILLPDKS